MNEYNKKLYRILKHVADVYYNVPDDYKIYLAEFVLSITKKTFESRLKGQSPWSMDEMRTFYDFCKKAPENPMDALIKEYFGMEN